MLFLIDHAPLYRKSIPTELSTRRPANLYHTVYGAGAEKVSKMKVEKEFDGKLSCRLTADAGASQNPGQIFPIRLDGFLG